MLAKRFALFMQKFKGGRAVRLKTTAEKSQKCRKKTGGPFSLRSTFASLKLFDSERDSNPPTPAPQTSEILV